MTVGQTVRGSRTRTPSGSATAAGRKPAQRKTAEKKTTTRASTQRKTVEEKAAARVPAQRKTTEKKTTTRASTQRKTAGGKAVAQVEHKHEGLAFTLDLPMMSVRFHPPHLHLPHISLQEAGQAVDAAKSFLPPADRMVYYGGLGALAVAGLIEWPVAAAIGVGTMIAQRARGQRWPASPTSRATTTSSHRSTST
ncbi:hypothetical protein [Streptosporangium sp. NPDC087985]|uniref:hypothetical protein n=1 Tax=Streptosporangium sp. NPDC087985 TaxID=3366196 RepID=UPI00382CC318